MAPTAPSALLCGDPARALAIAQRLLVQPRMSNHHRGLWGYHGETADGTELTVQATGIGGPSAAIVIGELAELGLRRAIRVGTCAALGASPPAGSALVARRAVALDGTSAALGIDPGSEVRPDPELTEGMLELGLDGAVVVSADLPPGQGSSSPGLPAGSPDPRVGDLQTAAVLASANVRGIRAAAGVVVGSAAGRRLEDEPLEARLLQLAQAAAASLRSLDLNSR
jgi:hypothetical protein